MNPSEKKPGHNGNEWIFSAPHEHLDSIDALRSLHTLINEHNDLPITTIVIPAGTCGQASGANDLIRVTKREILDKRLSARLRLRVTGCHGFCQMEPSVLIEPGEIFYPKLRMEQIPAIIAASLNKEVVRDLLYRDSATGEPIERQSAIPFFKEQQRTILCPERTGRSDPDHRLHRCGRVSCSGAGS